MAWWKWNCRVDSSIFTVEETRVFSSFLGLGAEMEIRSTRVAYFLLFSFLVSERFGSCASLNEEGRALLGFRESIEDDPSGSLSNWGGGAEVFGHCSWFGVQCSRDGRVVALILKDLSLKGMLSSELGWLVHIQILDVSNNSFYGPIPGELGNLPKLQVLELSQNNLNGAIPSDLGKVVPSKQPLLKGNKLSSEMPTESQEHIMISEVLADRGLQSCRRCLTKSVRSATLRQLLQARGQQDPASAGGKPHLDPSSNSTDQRQQKHHPKSLPPSQLPPIVLEPETKKSSPVPDWAIYTWSISGALCLVALSAAVYLLFSRTKKDNIVMPWATGLSGQLSKAFVTGVPSLGRAELESACEDFSNVIGTLSDCALYKGTLSGGVEIAVVSTSVKSAEEWSDRSKEQFRNKISVLSEVNHKNFMNLLGYCTCEEPFTRMMVFEYAPCGSLFEHLHIREAEHLDWPTRLRIIMGVTYCLVHMNQLDPPLIPTTLRSSSIYLTDDYAAKISDIEFWKDDKDAASMQSTNQERSFVYKFGILLLEVISGRLPFSEDHGLLVMWASSYLDGKRPLNGMTDPTLKPSSVPDEDVAALCDIVRLCINRDVEKRPTMAEVARLMKGITSLSPEQATPRDNPLWWAELEIVSAETG